MVWHLHETQGNSGGREALKLEFLTQLEDDRAPEHDVVGERARPAARSRAMIAERKGCTSSLTNSMGQTLPYIHACTDLRSESKTSDVTRDAG